MSMAVADLLEILRCPNSDRGELSLVGNMLTCQICDKRYAIENEIIIMLQEAK